MLVHWFVYTDSVNCSRRSQSRSPAVIIAYMISQLHYTYDQAVNVVKGAHFCVNLNPGLCFFGCVTIRF